MINRVTRGRIAALSDEYRSLALRHPQALEQIALAELAETVQQSNAIENSTLTLDDTERILDGRLPSGRHELREVFEAKNLASVTAELLAAQDPGGHPLAEPLAAPRVEPGVEPRVEPLSVALVLRWHRALLAGIRDDAAGGFRRADEWVRVGSHLGANPEFVPGLLRDALERYVVDSAHDVLDAVARFHCEFEVIHPFVDGNGRIGRVLINKQLQDAALPPIIVRARGRRADYYPALERYARSDDHGDMTRLLALLLLESLHKRIALLTSRRVIPLAEWARTGGVRGTVAANRAKRQTLPAFRVRDRWMIALEYGG